MPLDNNFQHAEYSRAEPKDRLIYRELPSDPAPDSPAWSDAMALSGRQLARNGVRLVINARKSLEAEARLVSAVKNQAGAE